MNNDWQALGHRVIGTQEIARIVASNTARIDLPMWLQSDPYTGHPVGQKCWDVQKLTHPRIATYNCWCLSVKICGSNLSRQITN